MSAKEKPPEKAASPTQQRAEAAREAKREAFDQQVRDGSLVVRKMTKEERERHEALRAEPRPQRPQRGKR